MKGQDNGADVLTPRVENKYTCEKFKRIRKERRQGKATNCKEETKVREQI